LIDRTASTTALLVEIRTAPSALMVRSRLDRKSQEDYKCTVKCNDVRV
jgi:hypothetical protein